MSTQSGRLNSGISISKDSEYGCVCASEPFRYLMSSHVRSARGYIVFISGIIYLACERANLLFIIHFGKKFRSRKLWYHILFAGQTRERKRGKNSRMRDLYAKPLCVLFPFSRIAVLCVVWRNGWNFLSVLKNKRFMMFIFCCTCNFSFYE